MEIVVALGVMSWSTLILTFGISFGEGEVGLPDWAIWLGLLGYPTLSMAAVTYSVRLRARRSAMAHLLPLAVVIAPVLAPLVDWDTAAAMPICSTTVTPEMTGDLETDLVGAWQSTTGEEDWHHPLAYIAGQGEEGDPQGSIWPGRRTWMFRPDGTGHVWWEYGAPGQAYANSEEFVWGVADGRLIVNDLPPAELNALFEGALLLAPVDDTIDPHRGVVLHACDLDLPQDVRGYGS
ncbi:MAG TPA: hypothetical protein VF148_08360 [Acidimicrobiia bacterium]